MLDHERLDVYQTAIDFLALAHQIIAAIPRGQGPLAEQLRRAALSVPLNIAEGTGRVSRADRKRFYATGRGSAMECGAVIDALHVLGVLASERHSEAKVLLERIVSMLTRMIV